MPKRKTHEEYVAELKADGRGIVAVGKYINAATCITHRCQEHHEWLSRPTNILSGSGCPHCAGRITEDYQKRLDNDGRGIQALEPYKNIGTKIKHKCRLGHEWKARPSHVLSGTSCPECAGKNIGPYQDRLKKDGRGFVALEPYLNSYTPILHQCKNGHIWKAQPASIINAKCGCPSCSVSGFDPYKPATLYYLRVAGGKAYKVGITNRPIKYRFKRKDLEKIEIISETRYEIGQDAYEAEQLILKKFQHCVYRGEPLLKDGNTEMFDYDVLGLDVMEEQFRPQHRHPLIRTRANYASVQSLG